MSNIYRRRLGRLGVFVVLATSRRTRFKQKHLSAIRGTLNEEKAKGEKLTRREVRANKVDFAKAESGREDVEQRW